MALGLWFLLLAVDQLTKLAALAWLQPHSPVEFLGSLVQWNLYFNPGAAFGMGENATVVFSVFAILATLGCLFVGLARIRRLWHGVALGLFLAGITGNLVDRLFQPPSFLHGHVIDFIQVPWFAIFNVADICITFGAALVIIGSLFWDDEHGNPKRRKAEA